MHITFKPVSQFNDTDVMAYTGTQIHVSQHCTAFVRQNAVKPVERMNPMLNETYTETYLKETIFHKLSFKYFNPKCKHSVTKVKDN